MLNVPDTAARVNPRASAAVPTTRACASGMAAGIDGPPTQLMLN